MGDRTIRFYGCRQDGCYGTVEEYDAPSSLIFAASCDKCGWQDPRSYYEVTATDIVLCTEKEAKHSGWLVTCKTCGILQMGSLIRGDKCFECEDDIA